MEVLIVFVNAAYLHDSILDMVDQSKPLIVTSCGNYRIQSRSEFITSRPNGRKDYQLLYIASGCAHFFINGSEKIVTAGHVIIYLPDQAQEYIYYKEDKTNVYWIHFTGSDVNAILQDYDILHIPGNILYVGTSPDYQWLFGQIIQELQLCKPRYEELPALLLRNIFVLISRNLLYRRGFNATAEQEISFAMYYFQKNYNQPICIEEYAASRGFSTCWFIRCFKQVTGSTPLQYILNLRISNAQSLLESTDSSITEIANFVGYENPLYFSRLFCKQIGISPKEYRKIRTKKG